MSEPLLELIRQLRDDVTASRDESRESRARQRERMDQLYERLGRVDTALALYGSTDEQIRRELDELRGSVATLATVVEGQTPTTREWQMAKTLGVRFATWLGVAMAGIGMTAGAWVLGVAQQVWDALRAALRLP